ncbi:homoserine dehydrogenase [Candidatus Uhrbacteria bacterium]|nr:homoserine dehydrogenase [Candidatus Uhrbacteria bacterium]
MQQIFLLQLGYGSVGKEFVRQLHAQRDHLQQLGIDLRLTAIATSTQYRRISGDVDPMREPTWDGTHAGWGDLKNKVGYTPAMIVVDMSAAETSAIHRDVIEHGGVVVTANKKPLTDHMDVYRVLHGDTKQYFYETTVGSSTPVIQTLQDIVATGDEVREIQALLSGTLGFLCSELRKPNAMFSDIVSRAKAQGYTEPHPRDDLSGLDVARKALILGREIGRSLELSDIHLEGLVSKEIEAIDDVSKFLTALKELDHEYADKVRGWQKEGKVPQFVARITKDGIHVGLEGVPQASPLGRLEGPENLVTFRTRIFDASPLVLQGRGAGATYTAAGVLSDVIRAVRV